VPGLFFCALRVGLRSVTRRKTWFSARFDRRQVQRKPRDRSLEHQCAIPSAVRSFCRGKECRRFPQLRCTVAFEPTSHTRSSTRNSHIPHVRRGSVQLHAEVDKPPYAGPGLKALLRSKPATAIAPLAERASPSGGLRGQESRRPASRSCGRFAT
jgi:hypothetical protein